MAFQKTNGFLSRKVDHVTDELVSLLSGEKIYEFKELFLKVYEGLKLKNAVSGGEEMLRLRCYEKLQTMANRGLVEKKGKTYRGLKNLEQMSTVHRIARHDAAISARVAKAG